ncbi:hypothetical protein A3C20_02155 [Candidatus Kaiserbacteria bacterium RIFCSPHIGHO2_02_FULL_55_25]|uniref:Uncharacterized protein n=1 Tax=Candidatus Kaiserbacteria bacterium RIFCSPHIGHO2_02_FULL_55_25 TaxID=1798498 RepID=A0A1F6E542_9BACT|nr:MAG: hypothetical protein A3C20_02155 [Candidatus Kaiserbacteria bacterium RIFCSPHIGHO2_02_FULL_55_25]
MGLEKGGWNKREVDAAKSIWRTDEIETTRKIGLEKIATDHQISVEDVNSIQVTELPTGGRQVSGTLNGVDIRVARRTGDNRNIYEGSVGGKELFESDAKDVYWITLGIANRRDQINGHAIGDSIDVIDEKLEKYQKNAGALLNKALGHTLNPDTARQDKAA